MTQEARFRSAYADQPAPAPPAYAAAAPPAYAAPAPPPVPQTYPSPAPSAVSFHHRILQTVRR